MTPAPLALTLGDPAGIGPEISLKAWKHFQKTGPRFAVIGDLKSLQAQAELLELPEPAAASVSQIDQVFEDHLPVIELDYPESITPGHPSIRNARSIIASIEKGTALALSGQISGLVTNPISKSVLYAGGFQFPGHTEFLADLCQSASSKPTHVKPVMMLMNTHLKCVPVTIHLPLKKAIETLDTELITQTCRIVDQALKHDFGLSRPRLAVSGLNPHAGEDGHLGQEDQIIIKPSIEKLKSEGISVSGPLPADTLFHAEARQTYDVAICMYHDQALIPVKTLDFHGGVNVTLGLPIIRTSPDHGTAFNIAGQGRARADSLIAALLQAGTLTRHRMARHEH